jgi:DNA-binding transcriptional MocR family regulator
MGAGDGLYLTTALPDHIDEPALLATAARHGVGVEGLSLHSYAGSCPPGVVLGHGYMPEPAIARGVELLREAADGM